MSERIQGLRNIITASALTAGLLVGAAACGNESSESTTPATIDVMGDGTVGETTSTLLGSDDSELLANIFNPTAEELKAFSCSNEINESYGVDFVEVDGKRLAIQVLPAQMGVEKANRDTTHRDDSDSLNHPFTVEDLNNGEDVRAELAANWCDKPALTAATLHAMVNTSFEGQLVGEFSEMLKPLMGKSADEISTMLTIPFTATEGLTDGQQAANIEATELRQKYAEYLAAVFKGLQFNGEVQNVNLVSNYALAPESTFGRDENGNLVPAKYSVAGYIGNAVIFGYTRKGADCDVINFGFNSGTADADDKGGDMRPVDVTEDEICETPVITTTVPGDTVPNTPTTLYLPPKKDNGQVPGGGNGGTPDVPGNGPAGQDVDPNGQGDGDVTPIPTQPTTVETAPVPTTPATTGTQVEAPPAPVATSVPQANGDMPAQP